MTLLGVGIVAFMAITVSNRVLKNHQNTQEKSLSKNERLFYQIRPF